MEYKDILSVRLITHLVSRVAIIKVSFEQRFFVRKPSDCLITVCVANMISTLRLCANFRLMGAVLKER